MLNLEADTKERAAKLMIREYECREQEARLTHDGHEKDMEARSKYVNEETQKKLQARIDALKPTTPRAKGPKEMPQAVAKKEINTGTKAMPAKRNAELPVDWTCPRCDTPHANCKWTSHPQPAKWSSKSQGKGGKSDAREH